jgi:hypothetical protein
MLEATKKYNRLLSKNVIEKAAEETVEEWYTSELVKSNADFINWLQGVKHE